MAALVKIAVAVLLAAVVMQPGEAAISCPVTYNNLRPCLPYVTNRGPLGGCCVGVRRLNGLARTTPDRRGVCLCLKSILKSKSGIIDPKKAAALPKQCGLNIPYQITQYIDCSRVK